MRLIIGLLDLLGPSRAKIADMEDRLDIIEWRLTCLEAQAAQAAFEEHHGPRITECHWFSRSATKHSH